MHLFNYSQKYIKSDLEYLKIKSQKLGCTEIVIHCKITFLYKMAKSRDLWYLSFEWPDIMEFFILQSVPRITLEADIKLLIRRTYLAVAWIYNWKMVWWNIIVEFCCTGVRRGFLGRRETYRIKSWIRMKRI